MVGTKGNGNNGAVAMLERGVNNIRGTLGRFAPELLEPEYAQEIWRCSKKVN
jgi:RIO kinase 1